MDLQYDPLYDQYLTQTRQFCLVHLSPVDLPMLPENMPYYRGPRVKLPPDEAAADTSHIQTCLTETVTNSLGWSTPLSIMPVHFGTLLMRNLYLCSIYGQCITRNTPVMHFKPHSSLGWCTTSLTDISHPLLSPLTYHFGSALGVIPHKGVAIYLANLLRAHGYLALVMTS